MLLQSDSVDWMRAITADMYDQPFWFQFLLDCKISLRAVMRLVDMTGDAIFTKISNVSFYDHHRYHLLTSWIAQTGDTCYMAVCEYSQSLSILHFLVERHGMDKAKALLAVTNDKGHNALVYAVHNGNSEICQYLIEQCGMNELPMGKVRGTYCQYLHCKHLSLVVQTGTHPLVTLAWLNIDNELVVYLLKHCMVPLAVSAHLCYLVK